MKPAMIYESECREINKKEEIKMNIAEMKIRKWICNVIRLDKILNEYIRKILGIANVAGKIRKKID